MVCNFFLMPHVDMQWAKEAYSIDLLANIRTLERDALLHGHDICVSPVSQKDETRCLILN